MLKERIHLGSTVAAEVGMYCAVYSTSNTVNDVPIVMKSSIQLWKP